MIVDSSALPEQVVDAVITSAFRSAGQRCSALRLLCVHGRIADGLIEMLAGAMAELKLGDPGDLATDVGPLVDGEAHAGVTQQIERLRREARLVAESPPGDAGPLHVAPIAFELASIADLKDEIFGPVLHIVRWDGDVDSVVAQINALGYGLTLGVHTRIDSRALRIAEQARVGNVYVNRNMVGAVVGVQPFGGEGQSGTGPKAGGPYYLDRFLRLPGPGSAPGELPAPDARAVVSLASLQAALPDWAARPVADRIARLRHVAPSCAQAEAMLAERALPGPTGERNTLRLRPRGVFAVIAHGADESETLRAVAAALVAGNVVALVGDASGAPATLLAAGVPAECIAVWPPTAAVALLAQAPLAGVCVVTPGTAMLRSVARALAARDGALLPLIARAEAQRADRLWRFCAEQTLTVNTAAAGGNVELLATVGGPRTLARAAGGG